MITPVSPQPRPDEDLTATAGRSPVLPLARRRVVFFHAHPDDEAIFTGGTIAMLTAMGCSVTVVVATSGQLGRHPGVTCGDIGRVRETETRTACKLLGVDRVEFLRYRDSGMPGDPANRHPEAFLQADIDEAAGRLARIAGQQQASDLVVYDASGIYGHPDHIQVHRVGTRAAQLAGVPTLYESTVDRDYLQAAERSHLVSDAHRGLCAGLLPLGVSSSAVTTPVGIGAHCLGAKRHAITAHRSQVLATSSVATMPMGVFAQVYGWEWYIRRGPAGTLECAADNLDRRPLAPAA